LNRKLAEQFGEWMFNAIVAAGGSKATAYHCLAEWWVAIERGDFG